MLIYTLKLEKYIKNRILPRLLLQNTIDFNISEDFRMKPYVTEIDVSSHVYPAITKATIYDRILQLIDSIQSDPSIVLIYIVCGVDNRFGLNNPKKYIKSLLSDQDGDYYDKILQMYPNNNAKQTFYINKLTSNYYYLAWTPTEIINNSKILPGNVMIKFTDTIRESSSITLQYYVRIAKYPVPININIGYGPAKEIQCIGNTQSIKPVINNSLYDQLLSRIDTYHILHNTNNLDISTAMRIVSSIVADIKYIPIGQTNIITKIKKITIDNPPNIKITKWAILLYVLYDDIKMTEARSCHELFTKRIKLAENNEGL